VIVTTEFKKVNNIVPTHPLSAKNINCLVWQYIIYLLYLRIVISKSVGFFQLNMELISDQKEKSVSS